METKCHSILKQQFDLQMMYKQNKRKYKLEKNRAEKARYKQSKLLHQKQPSNIA